MIIGLVSEPKDYTRKILIKGLLGIEIRDRIISEQNPFELEVGILPFSKKRMDRMSPQRFTDKILKVKKRLIKHGAEKVIISRKIKNLCEAKGIRINELSDVDGKKLFLRLIPFCLREITKKCGIDLMSKPVCIRDTEMDRISEYLMRALCFDVKNLIVCTKNTERAYAVCEAFYDETGFWVHVADDAFCSAAITIDVDNALLSVGRELCICEAEFGYELEGYDASHTDLAVCLSDISVGKAEWVFNYKSVLR